MRSNANTHLKARCWHCVDL